MSVTILLEYAQLQCAIVNTARVDQRGERNGTDDFFEPLIEQNLSGNKIRLSAGVRMALL
jgi:hypothetical protein